MLQDPSPISLIAGVAILTNACAIMQNGASMRYNLAITQWRDFQASLAAGDERLSAQYTDTGAAVTLSERRVRLQLRGLGLLNIAVTLFAATTIFGLGSAVLAQLGQLSARTVSLGIVSAGSVPLMLLLGSTIILFLDGACGRALLRLHRQFGGSAGSQRRQPYLIYHAI